MKKILGVCVFIAFFTCFLLYPVFAASTVKDIQKLENEIHALQSKLAKTKNKIQITRIKRLIKGHTARLEELKGLETIKTPSEKAKPFGKPSGRMFSVKGGLAGGAVLFGMTNAMPAGPVLVGGELGYAVGNQFGIVDAGLFGHYPMGVNYIGLEISYAGYSKDVTNVPGLSGTTRSGVGVGLVYGRTFDKFNISLGYNTALGLRADAVYRL